MLKKLTLFLVMTLLLCLNIFALSIGQDDFYTKEDLPSKYQETALGSQLQCSSFADQTTFVWNNRDTTAITSKSVYCNNQPSLINWWFSDDKGATWYFKSEYQAPITFSSLRSDRDYKFECYYCPAGSLCTTLGEYKQINTNSYAVCEGLLTSGGNTAKVWKQYTCTSGQFFDVVLKQCVNPPVCEPDWVTSSWSDCIGGTQTRSVKDLNGCGINTGRPSGSQACIPAPECNVALDCGSGRTCQDGKCVILPSDPILCIENQDYCNNNNNLATCQNNTLVEKTVCSNGCGIKQGETIPKCIEEVKEGDYGIIITIAVILLIIIITIVAIIKRRG